LLGRGAAVVSEEVESRYTARGRGWSVGEMIEPDLAFRGAVEAEALRRVARGLSRGRPT
jgi:hypothetical protein